MSEDVLFDGSGNQLAQAGAEPIGIVMTSTGTVTVERADGTVDQLSAGDPVYEDDVLTTGDGSTVGIRFQDDSRFSLGEEGRMELDTFVYDADAGTGSSLIDVAQGSFAFVSGMIAKTGDDAMSVQTPVATIGVRGTTVAGDVGPDGQTEVTLLPDTDGTLGEIAVFNQAGLQIMFDAFQRIDIGGSDIAPTAPRTIEPSELRPDIADTVRAIGADPSGGGAPPVEDEDGGGSDPVDEAASPDAQSEDPDISEEIDTAADGLEPGGLEPGGEEPDGVELPGEDVAELTELDMEAAAEEVAEIEVSAGGDRAIVRMADGRTIEVDATELESGTVVGPNGSVITIDTVPSGVGRSYNRALAAEEEEEDRAATARETPNTFHNDALATGDGAAAINTLGNSGDFALNFSPEILQSLQNALDEELEPPASGPPPESDLHEPPPPDADPRPETEATAPLPDTILGRPVTEWQDPADTTTGGEEDSSEIELGIVPPAPPPIAVLPIESDLTFGVDPIFEPDPAPAPPPVIAPPLDSIGGTEVDLSGPIATAPLDPPLPPPPPAPPPLPETGVESEDQAPNHNPVGSITAPIGQVVANPPAEMLEDTVPPVESIADSVTEPVEEIVNGIVPPLTEIVEDVTDPIEEVVEDVNDPIEEIVEDVIDPVEEIVEDITDPVEEIVEDITDPVEEIVEDVTDPVEEIVEDITDPVEEIVEDVTDPVEEIVEDLPDPVDEVIGGVEEILSAQPLGEEGPPDDGNGGDGGGLLLGGLPLFDLSMPLLPPEGEDESEAQGEDDPEPPYEGEPPNDSASENPLAVGGTLNFGDELEDLSEDLEDTLDTLTGDGDGADDEGEDEGEDEGGGGDPELLEQLNLGQTVDDAQNLLDNFLHPDDPGSDGTGEESGPQAPNDPPDNGDGDGGGIIGGVFGGLFGRNDDPPDEGNGLF